MPDYHCQRCFEAFSCAVDLSIHENADIACQPQACKYKEKFSESQYRQLKRRWRGKDKVQAWYDVWAILFPDSPKPDTACKI